MSESNNVQIKLTKASKTLFWKYGIKRVTVEEICEQAEVSKMSFYRHFKNKEAIAETLIEQLFKISKKRYEEIMDRDDDFRIKVDLLVKFKYEEVQGISEEFINDIFRKDNSSLSLKFDNLSQQSLKQIRRDFSKAQQQGEIRNDLNIDFMMYMLDDMNKKLVDKELHKLYKTEDALVMELTNFFFYGILP